MENKNEKTIKNDNDKIFEEAQKFSQKDNEIAAPVLEKMLELISNELDADNEFTVRQGYIALTKAFVYLSQALCEDEEFFRKEIDAAQRIALDKVIPAMLPTIKDGKIVDEDYDQENLSIRRMMMALAQSGEYIIWRMLVTNLQEMKNQNNNEKTDVSDVEIDNGGK